MFGEIFRNAFGYDGFDDQVVEDANVEFEAQDTELGVDRPQEFDLGVDVQKTWESIWPY